MSFQTRDIYLYTPLSDESKIRTLTIYPGSHGDPLTGELNVVDIEKAGDYEALSYVWGHPDRCAEFICSNKVIALTSSLSGALRRIRRHDHPRRIWVDQLSINQDDKDERSKQVQFMNTIYRNATHVLVWLGDDPNNEAYDAFQLMHSLDQTFKDEESKEKFRLMYTEDLHD
jgi:Heterokaryon incompatibility protein (HET)